MKALYPSLALAALAFAACDDDSYNDWAQPQSTPDTTEDQRGTVSLKADAVSAINFADIDEKVDTLVTVFTPTLTSSAAQPDTVIYKVVLGNDETEVDATSKGQILTADLRAAIERDFGKAPTERTIAATVVSYTHFGSVVSRQTSDITVVATLSAPVIESEYYYYGTAQGWTKNDKSLKFTRADESVSLYDDPIFTLTISASVDELGVRVDEWFKIAPLSAFTADDFDKACLGSANDGDKGLKVSLVSENANAMCQPKTDGALKYKLTLDMMNYTLTVEPISFPEWVYVPGNGQGWKPDVAPALHSANMDGKYTGFAYLDGGFKFTKARDWNNGEYAKNDFKAFPEGFAGAASADDSNIECSVPGVYYLSIDLANNEFAATLIESFGVIGSSTETGWDKDVDMTFDKEKGVYTWTGNLTAGELKFRANDAWKVNLGGSTADDLAIDGGNLKVAEDGSYTVSLDIFRTTSTKISAKIVKN